MNESVLCFVAVFLGHTHGLLQRLALRRWKSIAKVYYGVKCLAWHGMVCNLVARCLFDVLIERLKVEGMDFCGD